MSDLSSLTAAMSSASVSKPDHEVDSAKARKVKTSAARKEKTSAARKAREEKPSEEKPSASEESNEERKEESNEEREERKEESNEERKEESNEEREEREENPSDQSIRALAGELADLADTLASFLFPEGDEPLQEVPTAEDIVTLLAPLAALRSTIDAACAKYNVAAPGNKKAPRKVRSHTHTQ